MGEEPKCPHCGGSLRGDFSAEYEMREKGLSYIEMAREMGVTSSTVGQRVKRHGQRNGLPEDPHPAKGTIATNKRREREEIRDWNDGTHKECGKQWILSHGIKGVGRRVYICEAHTRLSYCGIIFLSINDIERRNQVARPGPST